VSLGGEVSVEIVRLLRAGAFALQDHRSAEARRDATAAAELADAIEAVQDQPENPGAGLSGAVVLVLSRGQVAELRQVAAGSLARQLDGAMPADFILGAIRSGSRSGEAQEDADAVCASIEAWSVAK